MAVVVPEIESGGRAVGEAGNPQRGRPVGHVGADNRDEPLLRDPDDAVPRREHDVRCDQGAAAAVLVGRLREPQGDHEAVRAEIGVGAAVDRLRGRRRGRDGQRE